MADTVACKESSKWFDGLRDLFCWYSRRIYNEQEIRLLVKLDVFILLYTCVSYFAKSLDKASLTNAYGSGMDNDISFGGNDLSYAKSLYSAGYIISMCLGIIFVTRRWARRMLPILEILWGVLTLCQGAVSKPEHVFVLRFFIGLAEGPCFPCTVYIIGSWYSKKELFRRIMLFSTFSGLGSVFSGVFQEIAYEQLSGVRGLAGWRWGFIIDGMFTVPLGILGIIVFPGTPSQVQSLWWLTNDELKLAHERMKLSGVNPPAKLCWKILKKTFSSWRVYYFTTFWVLLNVVALPDGIGLQLWIKSQMPGRFSVSQYNRYPNIQIAVGIVVQFLFAAFADKLTVYPLVTCVQSCLIFAYASLSVWTIPEPMKWVCFMLIGLDTVNQMLVSGWINRACRRDAEERAIVLGFSDAVSQMMNIWTNIAFFPTSKAPEFRIGYVVTTIGAVCLYIVPAYAFYKEKQDDKLHNHYSCAGGDDQKITELLEDADSGIELSKLIDISRKHVPSRGSAEQTVE